jgi:hypothetical protein
MSNDNSYSPYAPPKSSLIEPVEDSAGMWRQGNIVVMRHDANFPARCIKCNAASVAPERKTGVYWHPWGYYLIALISLPLYAIVAFIVRKRATVYVNLCPRHQRRLIIGRSLGWAGLAYLALVLPLIFVVFQDALNNNQDLKNIIIICSVAFSLVWMIGTLVLTSRVQAKRIAPDYIYLKQCHKDFLNSLPEFTRR